MVEVARIEPDVRVWMITGLGTRKVEEIRRDDRTTMAFSDNAGEGYAALVGHSRLVSDSLQKKALWKLRYEAFFPGGPEGNNSILVEFVPDRIEIMHFTKGGDMAMDDGQRLSFEKENRGSSRIRKV